MAEGQKYISIYTGRKIDEGFTLLFQSEEERDAAIAEIRQIAVNASADVARLLERDAPIKGFCYDADALTSHLGDYGIYYLLTTYMRGLLSQTWDNLLRPVQTLLCNNTPVYDGDTISHYSQTPSVLTRTYADGAWTKWEKVSGSGGGGDIDIDTELDENSTNPVTNSAIATAIGLLNTKVQFFKGSVTNLDPLHNRSDLGIYMYVGSGWKGIVGVLFDAGNNVVQLALSSATPSYVSGNLLWTINGSPCVMARTYSDGAWSEWATIGGGGGGFVEIDNALSNTSENPVQNKVITSALANKANIADTYSKTQVDNLINQSAVTVDTALSTTSTNPVQNKVVGGALNAKVGGADYSNGSLVLYSDAQKTNEIDRVNLNVERILNFEIDETTGCLMMTEENMSDSMGFEIDENGNLVLTLE